MPAVLSPLQSSCHSLPHTAFFSLLSPPSALWTFLSALVICLFYLYLFSTRGSYSIHQTKIQKLLLLNVWLCLPPSQTGLDLSISFLSHFALSVSLSSSLFSINLPLVLVPLLHSLSPFLSLLHIKRRTSQLCLNLVPSLSALCCCYFDLPLPASDKQRVWWV